MHVLKVIFIFLEVLVLFNLLIFVHEWGHYLAARWRGLKVDRFAIWFGKPIWRKKFGDVEWALGWIPFGGYVSLPQMAPMEAIEGKSEDRAEPLPPISPLDKIIAALAGPLFSFLLAILFAFIVWQVGRPMSETETTQTIGYVFKDGPADKVGLKSGDVIKSVDGKPVTKFAGMGDSVMWHVVSSQSPTIEVKVLRDGKEMVFHPAPTNPPVKFWQRKNLRQIQIEPAHTAVVGRVFTNSPAYLAGLKTLDEVVEVNGQKIHHMAQVADIVERQGTNQLALKVKRREQLLDLRLAATIPLSPTNEARPRLGILWASDAKYDHIARPNPIEQIRSSISMMVNTLTAVFSPKSEVKFQHLSGAVKIFNIYYLLFESEHGWRLALWFSVVLNVNLAILNLLPFPVLDGGHILLALLEATRRRAINVKILNYVQQACAVILIGFMLYVTFFDIQDLVGGRRKEKDPVFAPPPAAALNK